MAEVQQVNIQCECHHRRGLLYMVNPLAWGRPCRHCRRMMDRNVVVVPTSGAAVAVNPVGVRTSPVMVTTTTQAVAPQPQMVTVTPAQNAVNYQQQPPQGYQQPQMYQQQPTVLPPTYDAIGAK